MLLIYDACVAKCEKLITITCKGGIPDDGFFRNAEAMILFYDITKKSRYATLALF